MANYYVIGNGTTAPNLTGTPYQGYQVITQSQIDGSLLNRFELASGDKVVVSGSTSGSVNLHPQNTSAGTEIGQPVDVTILPNTHTASVNFHSTSGHEFTPTVTVTGNASNVSIDGSSTQNMTVNVADKAAIANVWGGTDSNDVDTITTGANSTIGNIDTGGGNDVVTIGGQAGKISTGDGNDTVKVSGASGDIDTGGGNDNITISGTAGYVGAGSGDDTVTVTASGRTGDLDASSGNDTVKIDGTTGKLWGGNGDDRITVNGKTGYLDAGGGSDGITLGDGARVDGIYLGTGGSMGDTVTGGNNVTINGNITQAVGEDYSTIELGDNARITGYVDLKAGKDQLTLGSNSIVDGSITMGSDFSGDDADTLKIGKGSTIKDYINTNNGDDTVVIGENVSLLGGWNAINTQLGNDTVIIGKGVVATNPIFTGADSDRVVIEGNGNYTLDLGAVAPNSDVVEWNYKPGTEVEFNKMMSSKGYEYDSSTGKWYYGLNHDTTLGGVKIVNGEYIKGVTCFTPGMMIATDRGQVTVETLKVGDLVATRDNGMQPIRWIGAQRMSAAELKLAPQLRPVRISAGSLGGGLPAADLVVSPWHRMVVRSSIVAEMEGEDEALVAAINLTELDGVDVITDGEEVVYIHFMCDRHEVIEANGAQTETLNIGTSTASMMPPEALAEILHLFPELADGKPQPTVRRAVPGPRGRWMVQRHVKAGLPMVG